METSLGSPRLGEHSLATHMTLFRYECLLKGHSHDASPLAGCVHYTPTALTRGHHLQVPLDYALLFSMVCIAALFEILRHLFRTDLCDAAAAVHAASQKVSSCILPEMMK